MTHLKTWLVAAVATGALAACSKPADKAADAGAAGTDAATTQPASLTMPKRKAGLWEQQMAMAPGQGPGLTQQASICVDPASEGEMAAMGMQMSKDMECTEQRVTRRADGALEFTSVCPMGDSGTVASKGVMTGDMNSAYKMEMTSVTTGAASAQMNGEHKMTLTAAWKGPCPADMKPGDIKLAGVPGMPAGAIVNPAEMNAGAHMPTKAELDAMKANAEAMAKAAK